MANFKARILPDGSVSDAQDGVWDPSSLWSGLKISNENRAVDLVELCTVLRYPKGLDEDLCKLYVNQNGCLPGMVRLPAAAFETFECKRRVIVPDKFLTTPTASRSIYDIWTENALEFVNCGRRFSEFRATCDPGCGYASADRFYVWFYRTRGERLYGKHLRRLLDGAPRFTPGYFVTPSLLMLGSRFPGNFRFLAHGRSGGCRNAHGQHNDYVREAAQFMANNGVLWDYHNTETSYLRLEGLKELYPPMSALWRDNLLYSNSSFYAAMQPRPAYLAEDLVATKPFVSLAWVILVTERLALLAVEWYRQLYTQ